MARRRTLKKFPTKSTSLESRFARLSLRSRSNANSSSTKYSGSRTNSRCSSQSLDSIPGSSRSLDSSAQQDVDIPTLNVQPFRDINSPKVDCLPKCCACYPDEVLGSFLSNSNPLRLINNQYNYVPNELHGQEEIKYHVCTSDRTYGPAAILQYINEIRYGVMWQDDLEADARKVINETKIGTAVLEGEMDAVMVEEEDLEESTQKAKEDVGLFFHWTRTILEARDNQLIAEIRRTKRKESTALKSMYNELKKQMSELLTLYNNMSEAISTESLFGDLYCLMITEKVEAKIKEVDEILLQSTSETYESCIGFSDIDSNLPNSIPNFGDVISYDVGPMGDRRPRINHNLPERPELPIPVQREPMPTHSFPVRVRMYRNFVDQRASRMIGTHDDFGNLCRPWGVACDQQGQIVVGDRLNHCIKIYNPDGSFIKSFGGYGIDEGQFNRPAGVAINAQQHIIVADKDNHRVQVFTMEGLFLLAFGGQGQNCGQFNYPWDVAVNSESQIVVSDTKNHRIQLFTAEGTFLRKFGFEESMNTWHYFDSPRGVAFNPEGNVVVTDFNNHKVFVVDSNFVDVRMFRCRAYRNTDGFLRPQGVVVDDIGNIVVVDSKNHRIQAFNKYGILIWRLGGKCGDGENEMDRPAGIALCPDGKIAVVDSGNNRVLIF